MSQKKGSIFRIVSGGSYHSDTRSGHINSIRSHFNLRHLGFRLVRTIEQDGGE